MLKKCILFTVIVGLLIYFPAFAQRYSGKKVLYIDSYHEGYEWSDGITKGVRDTLEGSGVTLEIYRMDTKRNTSEEFKVNSGLKAKAIIEEFRPDVVIASDDNASKYIIAKFYKDADLPFVFCGLNWDASIYGYPYNNVTGMVEVALIPQLIDHLKVFAKGNRIGYIAADVVTARKEGEYYRKYFNLDIDERYVKTMDEWKKVFNEIQNDVDILIVGNYAGINDWNYDVITPWMEENTTVPTGCIYDWMAPLSLVGLTKVAEEQGIWGAQAALKILGGTPPTAIPIVKNRQGKLYLNLKIAKNLGVRFRSTLLKHAEVIE